MVRFYRKCETAQDCDQIRERAQEVQQANTILREEAERAHKWIDDREKRLMAAIQQLMQAMNAADQDWTPAMKEAWMLGWSLLNGTEYEFG